MLRVENLHVRTNEREIINGVNLTFKRGETYALVGPNASGKSRGLTEQEAIDLVITGFLEEESPLETEDTFPSNSQM